MIHFTIRIADQNIGVSSLFDTTRQYCEEYLSDNDPDFWISMSQSDIEVERVLAIRETQLEGLPLHDYADSYLETLALQRHIAEQLISRNTILFHGSVIAVDGVAYLFTAKSGTGKSTHTRLWRELFGHAAVTVNDDKPFLRITDDAVFAYGTPWNGKHHLASNISVPLKSICILNRGSENSITKISGKDALFMLLQQSYRPAVMGNVLKYMDLIDQLAERVDFYNLICNMNLEAAIVSYEAMSGNIWGK